MLLLAGLYGGLIVAPADYQQGDSYRIIFVHVPSAWMSLFIYVVMAFCGGIVIVWRMKLAEVVLISSAPIGASFTFLALITGSLWGKPMWGTYWVWDARLTSEGSTRGRNTGSSRRGEHSGNSFFGRMVEFTAPGPYRDQTGQTFDTLQYVDPLVADGAGVSGLLRVGPVSKMPR